jgi:hypothetical protein
VLRLQGSGLCDLKPDRCVASDQIDNYLKPNRRSEITFPSEVAIKAGGVWRYFMHGNRDTGRG